MAKRPQPILALPPLPALPQGRMKDVSVVKTKEAWNEFKLSDGTVLLVKPAIVEARRVIGQYNPDGEPLYVISIAMVTRTRAPQSLKQNRRSS
jgi:hypothetical protein